MLRAPFSFSGRIKYQSYEGQIYILPSDTMRQELVQVSGWGDYDPPQSPPFGRKNHPASRMGCVHGAKREKAPLSALNHMIQKKRCQA